MPDAVQLGELLRQVLTARGDGAPCLRISGAELRRFRDALYVVKPLPAPDRGYTKSWNGRGSLRLESLGGELRLERTREGGIDAALLRGARIEIRIRRGGESLRFGGRRRTLRNLLQEADLAPWMRARLPFIYLDGVLAAVAGIGVDSRFRAQPGRPGLLPVWRPD
jgi:tRNA(Ile)-lysidine synthase